MTADFLQRILPVFYSSAEQPGNWLHALDQIREEMQVGSAVVQMFERKGHRLAQQWTVRDSISTAQAELHDRLVNNDENPRLELDIACGPPPEIMVIRDDGLAGARRDEFEALYRRLRMVGLGRCITLELEYPGDRSLCLLLHRNCDDTREFTHGQEQLLLQLTPHLRQTVSLAEKLGQVQAQAEIVTRAVDQMNSGVVVFDGDGNICWVNACAQQIIARSAHLSLAGGRLRCESTADKRTLNKVLALARSKTPGPSRYIGTVGQDRSNPVQVLAVRDLRRGHNALPGTMPAAFTALYLSERETRFDLPALDIASLFGLTPAEARLAIALSEGASINDYAASQGIAAGTARIQLKSIFSKLGINRQPELVRLICSSISAKALHTVV